MRKSLIRIISLLTLILLSTSPVFALTINTENSENNEESSNTVVESVTSLEIVDKNICSIDLTDTNTGNVIGNFTKELTDFDASKKEATLTLTLKNVMEEEKISNPVEILFVLDNSSSMSNTYNETAKVDYVANTASLFTDLLFEYFENPKIGIVSFSCIEPVGTTTEEEDFNDGTISDATLLLGLSDSVETIKSKITEYKNQTLGQHTNIEAGLTVAENTFSDSTTADKYIILISDGVPNLCLNTETTLQYSGVIASSTKAKLESLATNGYHIFSVLMGLNEADVECPADYISGATEARTYRSLAEEIFGTTSNPTAGNFFYIDYNSLDSTINEDIYKEITNVATDSSLTNVVIKDYFPQEIIDNFNFEYVASPNIGSVSEKIDTTDNSITWEIELLNAGEVATLSYKLTLKDDYDKSIVDTILPTNSKVDINYTYNGTSDNAYSTVSPTLKVKYVQSSKDETVAKDPIPQTGMYTCLIFIIIIIGIVAFTVTKITQIKKLK